MTNCNPCNNNNLPDPCEKTCVTKQLVDECTGAKVSYITLACAVLMECNGEKTLIDALLEIWEKFHEIDNTLSDFSDWEIFIVKVANALKANNFALLNPELTTLIQNIVNGKINELETLFNNFFNFWNNYLSQLLENFDINNLTELINSLISENFVKGIRINGTEILYPNSQGIVDLTIASGGIVDLGQYQTRGIYVVPKLPDTLERDAIYVQYSTPYLFNILKSHADDPTDILDRNAISSIMSGIYGTVNGNIFILEDISDARYIFVDQGSISNSDWNKYLSNIDSNHFISPVTFTTGSDPETMLEYHGIAYEITDRVKEVWDNLIYIYGVVDVTPMNQSAWEALGNKKFNTMKVEQAKYVKNNGEAIDIDLKKDSIYFDKTHRCFVRFYKYVNGTSETTLFDFIPQPIEIDLSEIGPKTVNDPKPFNKYDLDFLYSLGMTVNIKVNLEEAGYSLPGDDLKIPLTFRDYAYMKGTVSFISGTPPVPYIYLLSIDNQSTATVTQFSMHNVDMCSVGEQCLVINPL